MSSTLSRPRLPARQPSIGFAVGWDVFRVTVWVAIVVWANPRLLSYVGGEGLARWLMDHRWVHGLTALPLGLLALISTFELVNDPRKHGARRALASTMGATLIDLDLDPTYGIPSGPGLRVPVGRRFLLVGTWRKDGRARTVAKVTVEARTSFSFLVRGADREPEMIRGMQQLAVGHSMRRVAENADDPRPAVAAAPLAYLAGPPIRTGESALDRAVVLRANQTDTARALLTARELVSAIAALDARTRRWDWSYYPAERAGAAEMQIECPGTLADEATLRAVQALVAAALAEMARAGIIAD